MAKISSGQKNLTVKYQCALMATTEYRKNNAPSLEKIRLPVDDDIADSRSLMYDCNVIIHVYNDIHDRKEFCEIFWNNPDRPNVKSPRLMLCVTKNKVGEFKDTLFMDLDQVTTSLNQVPEEKARMDLKNYIKSQRNNDEPEPVQEEPKVFDINQKVYKKTDYRG
jgi:hypothetical protein